MRVLIVDDDNLVRGLLLDILHREDVTLDAVSRYDEALEMIHQHEYDAITVDYKIIGGTGLDLLDELRSLERPIPVVVMISGHASSPHLCREALRRGAQDVLGKPIPVHKLLKLIYAGKKSDESNSQDGRFGTPIDASCRT
jgi:DNA-binding NtrC family response regulator